MTDTAGPEDQLRQGWTRASRTTVSTAAVLFLLSRGEKAVPGEMMKAFGVDWSALNPYAIGLFGVPVLAVLCLWSIWWARAFAKSQRDKRWYDRVITKTDINKLGDRARALAWWSLVFYVVLFLAGLGALLGKFLNGTFYFSETNEYSCLPKFAFKHCLAEGAGLVHFWPSHGLRSIWDTPYRYEGNLTYLPPLQAWLWVALSLCVLLYVGLYIRLLIRR